LEAEEKHPLKKIDKTEEKHPLKKKDNIDEIDEESNELNEEMYTISEGKKAKKTHHLRFKDE